MKRISIIGLMAVMLALSACGKKDAQVSGGHGAHEEKHNEGHNEGHNGEQASEEPSKTTAKWTWSSETPQSNEELTISTQIRTLDGKAVEQFDINHEKKLHLIIVSKDLSYFDHLHPEYNGKGEFEVKTTFPAGGEYKLIADYIPTGDTATTQSEWIKVSGSSEEAAPIRPSEAHSVVVDGVEVTLENDHPQAGEEFELDFKLTDASNKQPITDLEPYLGAVGHVVILSEDTERYLHVHPMDEKASGPDAKFMTTFPQAGIYKIWGQFQRNGKTFVSAFVVEVE